MIVPNGGVFILAEQRSNALDPDCILRGLNEPQREAVMHKDGPLLILAGAGSGKTTVLTRRVAYLISQGVDPWSILAITFTNKAANEMKSRIESMLGYQAQGIWAMTFHAMCSRILRTEYPSIGKSGRFTIMDSQDQIRIMRQVLKDMNLSERQYSPSAVLRSVSAAKDKLWTPEEMSRQASSFYETKVAQAYDLYQKKLIELHGMDFDDLIMETVFLLQKNKEIREKYQNKFKYIMVDEYQDTNRAQYELIRVLAGAHKNLVVVGDDDQSIYNFRGADLRNILEFEKDYPSCKVVKLEENYRSTQVILDGAYSVVSNNLFRKDKRLFTTKKGGNPIFVFGARDQYEEAQLVAEEVLRLSAVKPLNSIAILYRTHAQSKNFEDAFMRIGVPYTIVGGLRFYERKEIKDAISYLRLVVYPNDYISLDRIINVPPRGLGAASLQKIISYAEANNLSIIEALCNASSIQGLSKVGRKEAQKLGAILKEVAEMPDVPIHIAMGNILEGTGYIEWLASEDTKESEGRLENLQELLLSMKMASLKGQTVYDFLEDLALVSDQDMYDETQDACVLMTLHAAKGLEFDVVFLVGMEEGILPHARSAYDETQVEEERRLCYVGMTRAKELLYLTFAAERETYVGTTSQGISRFLLEIPEDLLEIRVWNAY
ncbi:MAG TPA: UvrD-helicase domain-containing protein [Bacillota bacterium]|nr:UvrD-helicase domain-containing protein [Bacillota bacterium]